MKTRPVLINHWNYCVHVYILHVSCTEHFSRIENFLNSMKNKSLSVALFLPYAHRQTRAHFVYWCWCILWVNIEQCIQTHARIPRKVERVSNPQCTEFTEPHISSPSSPSSLEIISRHSRLEASSSKMEKNCDVIARKWEPVGTFVGFGARESNILLLKCESTEQHKSVPPISFTKNSSYR